jgi:hypothetical protein
VDKKIMYANEHAEQLKSRMQPVMLGKRVEAITDLQDMKKKPGYPCYADN